MVKNAFESSLETLARPYHQPQLWSKSPAKPPNMSSFFLRRAATAPRAMRAFSTTPTRNVARITIIGHLADTPELQATSTGHEILKYSVASNSGSKDNRQTSWFRVASFEGEGPRRDFLRSLPKGFVRFSL